MYHKIEELAYNGNVQAIWSMLKDIVDNTWDVQCKTVHMKDPETGEDMVGSSFEAQRTSPRDLSEEESGIVKKLSDILLSRIDSLSDEELFQSTQMNYIDTVPYVKRLSEHNHPTALCRYAWILYRGEENHGVQRDLEESKKYLSRAVERACEITNGLKAFHKSEAKEDTETYEYRIVGDKTSVDFIEVILEALLQKKKLLEPIIDSTDIQLPYEAILHMIVGGDRGGRYRGIIHGFRREGDALILTAYSDNLSSHAFGSSFEIFFENLMTGASNVDVDRKKK